jgi:hypothetical protein
VQKRRQYRLTISTAAMLVAAWATPALAQDAPADQSQTQAAQTDQPEAETSATSNDGKWHFATIGYIWFAGAWGETDIIGPVPPVDLDLPFSTAIKSMKFAFMGAAEARKDKLVILGDLTFIHLKAKEGIGIRDPNFLKATLDSATAEVTLLGGYRVIDRDSVKMDLLAGARANFFKTTLELEGPRNSVEGEKKETWFDPLVAARVSAPLFTRLTGSLYGDFGGFGIGSDVTWQGIVNVDYQINRKMRAGIGWRYWKVNYDHGDFLYNVHQSGPLITFRTEM